MEVENNLIITKKLTSNCKNLGDVHEEEEDDDDHVPLPGFRFHPTDEELVGFYLRRKVEKKPISIELIKQADIYKYDPWDLPKSTNVGEKDKEWYFFCKRGRKYKNSVRPNRVTGSGFWKATGIDRPIYSGRDCIGLKKSLVYYRGSAGKGTKTEWMMHEFRLPAKHMIGAAAIALNAQEAEVWTLCRILKRNVPYRKCVPDWRLAINKKNNIIVNKPIVEASSETCSIESSDRNGPSSYISFSAPTTTMNKQNNNNNQDLYNNSSSGGHIVAANNNNRPSEFYSLGNFSLVPQATVATTSSTSAPAGSSWFTNHNNNNSVYGDFNELLRHADWEDLRSVVDCAAPSSTNHPMYL